MKLILDNREGSLIETFRERHPDISFEVQSLDLADIEIRGSQEQRFLLERKSIRDLAASLNDGRFKDQKDRLLGVLEREPKSAIGYVIEGGMRGNDTDRIQGRITLGMLRSLLFTIQFKYRIPVVFTTNVRDTASWINRFCKLLVKKPDFCPVGSGSNAGCSSYKTLMPAPVRNRANDSQSIAIAMLTTISGVSHKIGSEIVNGICTQASTLDTVNSKGFFDIIRENDRESFIGMLENIRISGRRVSKKIRESMVGVFYTLSSLPVSE
jgi:ERCC4-type nuclease